MKFSGCSLILFSLVISGCAGLKSSSSSTSQSLEKAENLQIGVATTQQLSEQFGSPAHAIDEGVDTKLLVFCDELPCKHENLLLRVSKTSNLLKSVVWIPKSTDSTVSIDAVLQHYKSVAFTEQHFRYDYGHYNQFMDFYSSKEARIAISYDPLRKIVTQISRIGTTDSFPTIVTSEGSFPMVTEIKNRDTASVY
jgi:hypothetical protein